MSRPIPKMRLISFQSQESRILLPDNRLLCMYIVEFCYCAGIYYCDETWSADETGSLDRNLPSASMERGRSHATMVR